MNSLEADSCLILLQFHVFFWLIACLLAFSVYYSSEEHRTNPEFAGQLHCLSGMILCNRPLFSTLMCGLGGAVLLALAARVQCAALVLVLIMFWALVAVVQYDVREHPQTHFSALAVEMCASTAFLVAESIEPAALVLVYYGVTLAFLLVIVLNFAWLAWTPPFMTVQALVEIAWVCALGICLGCVIFAN